MLDSGEYNYVECVCSIKSALKCSLNCLFVTIHFRQSAAPAYSICIIIFISSLKFYDFHRISRSGTWLSLCCVCAHNPVPWIGNNLTIVFVGSLLRLRRLYCYNVPNNNHVPFYCSETVPDPRPPEPGRCRGYSGYVPVPGGRRSNAGCSVAAFSVRRKYATR